MRSDNFRSPARRERGKYASQPAFADASWTDDIDDASGAADGLIENRGGRSSIPGCARPMSSRCGGVADAPRWPAAGLVATEGVCAFDPMQFVLAELHRISTRRAVDSFGMTPPGGAADSIRCAMPTCSPTAV